MSATSIIAGGFFYLSQRDRATFLNFLIDAVTVANSLLFHNS